MYSLVIDMVIRVKWYQKKEGQYFVDQATGQYYFQTTDGETMTVVSAPGIEEQGYLINVIVFISCANSISIEDEVTNTINKMLF